MMPRNLFFSTDIDAEVAKADIIFVSVNTPTKTGVSHTITHTCHNCTVASRWHGSGAVNGGSPMLFHRRGPAGLEGGREARYGQWIDLCFDYCRVSARVVLPT